MLQSYFFVPANHPNLTEKLATIKADYLIVDLEDSVAVNDRMAALKKLNGVESKNRFWVRPVVFDHPEQISVLFDELLKSGFTNFLLPKIRNLQQLKLIENKIDKYHIEKIKIIILVENPECLFNLQQIIEGTSIKIEGIGFGSQDYCTETGMKHNYEYLKVPRFQIMNTAKASGLKCIDIACMDAHAGAIFQHELQQAFEMGYNGKFLIHPAQLKGLQQYPFFSNDEIKEAIDIIEAYDRLGQPTVFVFNNKAIEPPHIKNFTKIIKWSKQHESK